MSVLMIDGDLKFMDTIKLTADLRLGLSEVEIEAIKNLLTRFDESQIDITSVNKIASYLNEHSELREGSPQCSVRSVSLLKGFNIVTPNMLEITNRLAQNSISTEDRNFFERVQMDVLAKAYRRTMSIYFHKTSFRYVNKRFDSLKEFVPVYSDVDTNPFGKVSSKVKDYLSNHFSDLIYYLESPTITGGKLSQLTCDMFLLTKKEICEFFNIKLREYDHSIINTLLLYKACDFLGKEDASGVRPIYSVIQANANRLGIQKQGVGAYMRILDSIK